MSYVCTRLIPAYEGTRGLSPQGLQKCTWLNEPSSFRAMIPRTHTNGETFALVDPHDDKEISSTCLKTECMPTLGTHRFESFQELKPLVESVALLKRFIKHIKEDEPKIQLKSVDFYKATETCIIKAVQQEMYAEEISCLRSSQNLPRNNSIL